MKTQMNRLGEFLGLIFSVIMSGSVFSDVVPTVRIMPLGDSITEGSYNVSIGGGYRTKLYELLSSQGFDVDFVGTLSDSMNNPALPDPDHEGHPGVATESIREGIASWLSQVQPPDIILLYVGTNDFSLGRTVDDVRNRLADLIGHIAVLKPSSKIIVGNFTRRTDIFGPVEEQFNQFYLPGIVSEQVGLGRQVYLANLYAALSPSDFVADGYHPNLGGYDKMAAAWAQAIMQVITPEGTPPSVLANGSFEVGALVNSSPFPQHQLDGWTITHVPSGNPPNPVFGFPANVDYVATDGSRVALLNGGTNNFTGTVSQTFATIPGATYYLDFDFGIIAAAGKAPRQQLLGVAVTGEGGGSLLSQDVPLTAIAGPAQWTARSYSFTATDATTTLAFTDRAGTLDPGVADFCDALLDHVRVSVMPSNTAPVADDDSYATTEGTVLVVAAPGVLDGDTDANSPALSAVAVAGPSHGSLTLNPDGSFTYTPNSGFAGTDSFSYKANDGFLDSSAATVSIVVNPAGPFANGSFELGALISNSPFPQYQLDGWTITHVPSGNPSNPAFGFPANADFIATEGSRVALLNGGGDNFSGAISQTILTVPGTVYTLQFDVGIFATAGEAPREQLLGVSVTGADDGSLLPVTEDQVHLTAINGPSQWKAKRYSFTANSTTTTLTFIDRSGNLVSPISSECDLLLDNVRVSESSFPNTAPVANAQSVSMAQDNTLAITLTATDSDGDSPTFAVATPPTHGTLSLTGARAVYTPIPGYSGMDSFTFIAYDGMAVSAPAMVSIDLEFAILANGSFELGALISNSPFPQYQVNGWTVTHVPSGNPPNPVFGFPANADFPATDGSRVALLNGGSDNFTGTLSQDFATIPGATYHLDFDFGIIAAAGKAPRQQLLGVAVTGQGGGTLLSQDVALTAIEGPAQWTARNYSFTATTTATTLAFTDKSGTLSPGVAKFCDALLDHVRVTAINTQPQSIAQSVSVNEDGTVDITLSGSDIDGDGLTFAVADVPAHGSLSLAGAVATYTPTADYNGPDSFTFTVNDGTADSVPATVSITVIPVNDSPTFTTDLIVGTGATEDTAYAGSLAGSATDIDAGDALTYLKVDGPAWLQIASNGTLSGAPGNSDVGANTFTVRVTDGSSVTDDAVLDIEVANVNDAPTFTVDPIVGTGATEDAVYAGSLSGSATDIDAGDALTYSKVDGPAWLQIASNGVLSGTPGNGDVGPNVFTVRATDLSGAFGETVLTIAVANVNDAPEFAVDPIIGTAATEDVAYSGTLAGSASDIDAGDALTYSKVNGPAWLQIASNGMLSGTPDNDDVGANVFTIRATDLSGEFDEAVLNIAVVNVNDAPVAMDDGSGGTPILTVEEDSGSSVAINVLANDSDVDAGASLTVTAATSPNGTANINLDGTALSFTPAPHFNGLATISYTISDGHGGTAGATVFVFVTLVNDAPVAAADAYTTNEDIALTVAAPGVLGNDADQEGTTLTAALETNVTNGSLLLNLDGSFTYTPNENFNGTDSFTYKSNDGDLSSAIVTVTLTVTAVNDLPVAYPQTLPVNEDETLQITLTGSDVESSTLFFLVVGQPSHGSVSLSGAVATYIPYPNYNGQDIFDFMTIVVSDGGALSPPATITINVLPVNDAPTFTVDPITGTAAIEDAAYTGTLAASATDIDAGDSIAYSKVAGPAWLQIASNGTLSGTPGNSDVGPNVFTIRATDLSGAFDETVLTIAVASVNDAPTFTLDPIIGTAATEDAVYSGTLAGSASDIDAGDTLAYTIVGPVWLQVAPGGTLSGTPGNSDVGANVFTVRATDLSGDFDEAVFTIEVVNVNDAPVAAADVYTTDEDIVLTVAAPGILGNDTDQDNLALSTVLVVDVENGTLTLNPDGGFSYTPDLNFNGTDSFTYKAHDGELVSNPVTVTITVVAVNDPPTFTIDPIIGTGATEDSAYTGSLAGSATDIDAGDALTYSKVDGPAWLQIASNGALSGTPGNGNVGANTFTVRVTDGLSATDEAVLTIAVSNVNDAPTADGQSVSTDEDTPLGITLSGSDIDGDGLSFSVTVPPQHGTLSGSGAGLTYTPEANFSGADSFKFTVNDGLVDSTEAEVLITVNETAGEDFTDWLSANGLTAAPGVDSDRDSISNAVEYVIGGNPANLPDAVLLPTMEVKSVNLDGNPGNEDYLLFTYRRTVAAKNDPLTTINVEWSSNLGSWHNSSDTAGVVILEEKIDAETGVDRVKVYLPVSLAVNGKLFARLGVFIDVATLNDPPVALSQTTQVDEDGSVPVTLAGTDSNGDPLTFTVMEQPLHGTLSGSGPNRIYTPSANYHGPDSFSFKVNDGTQDSDSVTVSINVVSMEEYTQWMGGFSLSASPASDSDGDSISNAVEYVIGGNPANLPDAVLLPTVEVKSVNLDGNPGNEDYLLFTYRRADLANTDPSTTITVEWSSDLAGPWTAATGTSGEVTVEVINGAGDGIDLVNVYIPRSSSDKLFARLGVVIATP